MGAAETGSESSEQAEPANEESAEGEGVGESEGRSGADVDDEQQDEGRPAGDRRREPRSLSRRAVAAIVVVVSGLLGVLANAAGFLNDSIDLFDKNIGPPPLIEAASEAISECSRPGYVCEQALGDPIRFAPGAGQLIAIGVNLYKLEKIAGDDHKFIVGSGVVVFEDDKDRKVRWRSQIATITAGYGVTGLLTDNTNHLFASFAETNHSGFMWVIDVNSNPVNFFGTNVGQLVIDSTSDDKTTPNGNRLLYTYREGWPANVRNPTTSRDVYEWNGTGYQYARCEVLGQEPNIGTTAKVIEVRPAGACKPMKDREVMRNGERPATEPPP